MERKQILKIVIVALFAALFTAGAYIKIPLAPVPVVLSTLFALIAGSCLPLSLAVASVIVYLFLGAIGLPVFTSGGGLAALFGPTGGYLIGLIPAVIFGSLIMKALEKHIRIASLLSAIVATIFIYVVGLPWLSVRMGGLSVAATLSSGLVPFIIGDTLKIIVSAIIAPVIRPRIMELLERDE